MASRPLGKIRIIDDRGYAYIPKILQNELGIKGKGTIPFYVCASSVLLVREGTSKRDIIRGINNLKEDLALRWKATSDGQNEAAVRGRGGVRGTPHGGDVNV